MNTQWLIARLRSGLVYGTGRFRLWGHRVMSNESDRHLHEASSSSDRVGAARLRKPWQTPKVISSALPVEETATTGATGVDTNHFS